jgi:hypothetical protein
MKPLAALRTSFLAIGSLAVITGGLTAQLWHP